MSCKLLCMVAVIITCTAQTFPLEPRADAVATCQSISEKISPASDVIYACSTKTPFAVKSGGHASNPGFSSTTGVHISFNRMTQVNLSSDKSSVELGMGLTWLDVYKALDDSGINVVGGRVPGPGVGGFTLGGGYSWKTNQHGLTCDTLKSLTLVLPNGTITQVDDNQPDLFFALKGGMNRFGVVTSAEYWTHPQVPQVYGGLRVYGADQADKVLNATADFFTDNTDPKAQIISTIADGFTGVTGTVVIALFFYDGPDEPDSFEPFDGIPALVDTVHTDSFAGLIGSSPAPSAGRGAFHTFSTTGLTEGFLAAVRNETEHYATLSTLHSGTFISYDIEPFLTNYGQYATDSAFPHADSPLPLNLDFAWLDPLDDDFWTQAMRTSVTYLTTIAQAEGIYTDQPAYPNYAIAGTSAEALYGSNAARLRSIRSSVDPDSIMELAGGFDLS
ncbi:MAG: hypothetical protein Q9159_003293 [Coniocarpon cinnabarinum]